MKMSGPQCGVFATFCNYVHFVVHMVTIIKILDEMHYREHATIQYTESVDKTKRRFFNPFKTKCKLYLCPGFIAFTSGQ